MDPDRKHKLNEISRPVRPEDRRGASAVEFAVVAPFLFLTLVGMIEVGRVMMIQHLLTASAREGAREAILLSATEDSVIDVVNRFIDGASLNLGDATIVVEPAPEDTDTGETIAITVSTPIVGVSNLARLWFEADYQLSATATMRKEGIE
jgi:Flp pilus assembly protein TadG